MAMLRKIKDNLKKIITNKKTGKPRTMKLKDIPAKLRMRKGSKPAIKQEKEVVIGLRETVVEKNKFSTPQETPRAPRSTPQDLPVMYGRDKIVLQTRDPWWLHTYWEVGSATYERLKAELGDVFYRARNVLRVYDVSNIIFDGSNAHRFFDIDINPGSSNWYIDVGAPGRSWCVDLGLLLPDGRFITIVRSNTAFTPIEGPSWVTDEEWMIPDEMFARLYGMGFGFGRTSPVGKAWQERMRRALFSGILSSPGLSSGSPVKRGQQLARKFWMVVNTELIVYGATEPDARVTVQGREIALRPDGTFSLRFALPDGKQVIPVKGTSADGVETRTITPIVTRETR